MNFYDTGLLCEPNSKFKYVSPDDTPTQGILARWKREREQAPQAAQRGFFNDHKDLYPMPAHIACMAAYRRNNGEGLEA